MRTVTVTEWATQQEIIRIQERKSARKEIT